MYKKKVLALVLVALLIVSLVPTTAFAAGAADILADLTASEAGVGANTKAYAFATAADAAPVIAKLVEAGYTEDASNLSETTTQAPNTYSSFDLSALNIAGLTGVTLYVYVDPNAPAEPIAPLEPEVAEEDDSTVVGITPEVPVVTVDAYPTNNKLAYNGTDVPVVAAYKIAGENYFKLRDIAALVNNSDIAYADGVITIILAKEYTVDAANPVSTVAPTEQTTATVSADSVKIEYVDGTIEDADLTAYKIAGSNYYRLRDLEDVFGFVVGYDNDTKTATIDVPVETLPIDVPEVPAEPETPAAASALDVLNALKEGDALPTTLTVDGKELTISWWNQGAAYTGTLADGVYGTSTEEGIAAAIGLPVGASADFVTWTPTGWVDATTVFATYLPPGITALIIWHK
jgi:hypothetical protein